MSDQNETNPPATTPELKIEVEPEAKAASLRAMLAPLPDELSDTALRKIADEIKQKVGELYAATLGIDGTMPIENQVRTGSLFALLGIKDMVETVTSGVAKLIERHKHEIAKHLIDRDQPTTSMGDPNLSITVKPDTHFGIDPQRWEELPKMFFQKRATEGAIKDAFTKNDRTVLALIKSGVIKPSPYLNVNIRRKPGRGAAARAGDSASEE